MVKKIRILLTMIYVAAFLFIIYAVILVIYYEGWEAQPVTHYANTTTTPFFSILIPARNEAHTLPALLASLLHQDYPPDRYEIIVINDGSEDETAAIAASFTRVQVINLMERGINSYKKKAIETGIAHARGEWIVCTDADCIARPGWLTSIATCIENTKAFFIAAPVNMVDPEQKSKPGILSLFQQLDFMMLQGITAAAVFKKTHAMCNGANVAYKKEVFYEVDGFAGIDSIASGDDMLLMQKILNQYPQQVAYVKNPEAIITTNTMSTWRAFLNQRIRWASKAPFYKDSSLKAVLVFVYLFNVSWVVLAAASCCNPIFFYATMLIWITKTLIEWPFIKSLSIFYGKKVSLPSFFLFQPAHIFYTVIAGLLGQVGKYEWKGRWVK